VLSAASVSVNRIMPTLSTGLRHLENLFAVVESAEYVKSVACS
jgi:hypothetical protein